MGLFDWFKSTPSNVTILDDRVWMTKQARLNGVIQAVSRSLAEEDGPDAIILVAHFPDSLDRLQQIVEKAGISGSITIASTEMLKSDAASKMSFDESRFIEIQAAERHPVASHDDAVQQFARSLPCRCRLVHHVSIEDPFMRAFCGGWVGPLLKRLGMAEDTAIENKSLSRQIKLAQQKLGRKCLTDLPADSAELWMEKNCPGGLA